MEGAQRYNLLKVVGLSHVVNRIKKKKIEKQIPTSDVLSFRNFPAEGPFPRCWFCSILFILRQNCLGLFDPFVLESWPFV